MQSISKITVAILFALIAWPAAADFVELERLLEKPVASLAEKLKGTRVVVAVRGGISPVQPWDIAQAAGVEVTEALRRHNINAVRAAADARLDELETGDQPFTAAQAKSLAAVDRQVLVGVEWLPAKKPRLKVAAFSREPAKTLWMQFMAVPEAAVSLEKNVPPMNRAAARFARDALGTAVLDGDCTRLADECLKAAGTKRRGIYRWGRELGPREPWLPGDLLQMERVQVAGPGFTRVMGHHTALVEDVRGDEVVVLHQNAFPEGKIVQRESWPRSGISGGETVAYRPWDWPKRSPLPPASPLRVSAPLVVDGANGKPALPVDLLHLVDPHLDRVQGVWFFDKGDLRSPVEVEARLQVPAKPPKTYRLRMAVERLQGSEMLGVGLIVAGRQTMVSIDGFNSKFAGIHNLDGKPSNQNESTKQGAFLPLNKRVDLECRVHENEIHLMIDQTPVVDWRGDPARLSLSPDWPVPHTDWLFVSSYMSEFDISSFTIEPGK
jgi:hypothetical protein